MTEFIKRHLLSILIGAGAVVLVVFIVLRVQEERAAPTEARQGEGRATPVVVAKAVVAPFTDTLQAVGSAAANESVEITSNVTDRVIAISFEEGELARAGQVLVQLDTAEEEAELAEAVANLDDQRRQLERIDALVATNSASRAQRDELRARMEGAAARVRGVRARIADRTITAPFTGLIGLREVSPGAFVTSGARITTLDDIEPVKLDFSIPENFLSSLRPGATVRARTVAYPGRDFRGVVANISPRVDPLTRSVAVRAELPNEERLLRPGMLLVVDLVREQRESLMVPESALIPLGDQQFLYRVMDGNAERVAVRIGARRPGVVEILGGIEAGDTIVVEGGLKLREGVAVRIQREIDALALIDDRDRIERATPPVESVAAPAKAREAAVGARSSVDGSLREASRIENGGQGSTGEVGG